MLGLRSLLPIVAFCFAISLSAQTAPSLGLPNHLSGEAPHPLAVSETALPGYDFEGGLIKINVVVTDRSAKPVTGLQSSAFTVLEDGAPSQLLSFHAFNGSSAQPDPPVQLVLVIDTVRMPGMLAAHEREEVEKFLRENEGHLAQPVSILRLLDSGLWLMAEPSRDGNALAEQVARDGHIRLIRKAVGPQGLFGSAPEESPGLLALKSLGDILTAERQMPGRKVLVWIGPRREENGAPFEPQRVFSMIVWFSTLLREAHVTLYSYSEGENERDDARAMRYKDFVTGVKSPHDAKFEDLDRKVLAVQSGGRVLDSSQSLAEQIRSCAEEGSAYYALSFNPAPAAHANEYHDLKIEVRAPGLAVRSTGGYYDEPYYEGQPKASNRVTVAQLEQALKAGQSKSDHELAQQLSNLELTERLSDTKLADWSSQIHGPKARQALIALADTSAFLAPPAAEIPADPPPADSAQRRMISLADDYLNETIQKLPNFFATRITARYEETPRHEGRGSSFEYQPLHMVGSSSDKVLYQRGHEIVDSAGATKGKLEANEPYLTTYGTFGPILSAAFDAVVASTDLSWSRWERDPGGVRGVFRYTIPRERSHFRVSYCCLPDGDGTINFQGVQGYRGEITIDATNGAVLRLTMQADLNPGLPLARSDVLVEYRPVEIGGKTYICPVKSVAIWRSRTVMSLALPDWGESFRSYGPFATMLTDMAFDNYHIFRADSRVLNDVPPPQNK